MISVLIWWVILLVISFAVFIYAWFDYDSHDSGPLSSFAGLIVFFMCLTVSIAIAFTAGNFI